MLLLILASTTIHEDKLCEDSQLTMTSFWLKQAFGFPYLQGWDISLSSYQEFTAPLAPQKGTISSVCVTAAKSTLKLETVYVRSTMQGQLELIGLGNTCGTCTNAKSAY